MYINHDDHQTIIIKPFFCSGDWITSAYMSRLYSFIYFLDVFLIIIIGNQNNHVHHNYVVKWEYKVSWKKYKVKYLKCYKQ